MGIPGHGVICGVVGLLVLTGCWRQAKLPEGPRAVSHVTAPYVIKVGDGLGVRFYQTPELNLDVPVRSDGKISVPPIGDVEAAGRTPAQLAAVLREQFAAELMDPRVTIVVLTFGGTVYVSGEVREALATPYTTGLSAMGAISAAGGFAETAKIESVILIRREGRAYHGYRLALDQVVNGKDPSADVRLQPGDVVFVPRSWIANVDRVVDQWVRKLLPIEPSFAPIGGTGTTGTGSSSHDD